LRLRKKEPARGISSRLKAIPKERNSEAHGLLQIRKIRICCEKQSRRNDSYQASSEALPGAPAQRQANDSSLPVAFLFHLTVLGFLRSGQSFAGNDDRRQFRYHRRRIVQCRCGGLAVSRSRIRGQHEHAGAGHAAYQHERQFTVL
jgi:hypothetical protein